MHQCHICQKTFVEAANLWTHQRIHTGQAPYQCQYCNDTFTCGTVLIRHQLRHTGHTPYPCRYCDRRFTYNGERHVHELSLHIGETPYKCCICRMGFNGDSNRATHEQGHIASSTIECRKCARTFARLAYLSRHEKLVHNKKIIDKTKCNFCGRVFGQKGNIEDHYRTHIGETPYECRFCQRLFGQLSNRATHEQHQHGYLKDGKFT